MYTLGYSFRPWTRSEGDRRRPVDPRVRPRDRRDVRHRSPDPLRPRASRARAGRAPRARWTRRRRERPNATCSFLYMCAGYYDYDAGYTPELPGPRALPRHGRASAAVARGPRLRRQARRRDRQRRDRGDARARAREARRARHDAAALADVHHVAARARRDRRLAARELAGRDAPTRRRAGRTSLLGMAFFAYCAALSRRARSACCVAQVARSSRATSTSTHFTPRYNPWDQRLCLVPDGDLFDALRGGRASIVTDHIETFTETGIALSSGAQLPADLIVTATGPQLQLLGGIADRGRRRAGRAPTQTMVYKGMMCSGVPNLAFAVGYTNASWTLKCDLTSQLRCRLLDYMDEHGFTRVLPRRDPRVGEMPLLDFSSGYVQRALPTAAAARASSAPWRLYQNYALDRLDARARARRRPGARARVDRRVSARPRVRTACQRRVVIAALVRKTARPGARNRVARRHMNLQTRPRSSRAPTALGSVMRANRERSKPGCAPRTCPARSPTSSAHARVVGRQIDQLAA